MPKETFFNLPEEKRQSILQLALKEFALNDYNTASLSRIVEKAGIAKGSMYQYFENKKDLYLYLIKYVSDEKLSGISSALSNLDEDIFQLFKQINMASARYDLSHPLYSGFLSNVIREVRNEELGDISSHLKRTSDQYMEQFVKSAQSQGRVRSDLDPGLVAFIISRLSIELSEYVSHKYGFSYTALITDGSGRLPISDEQIETELDAVIEIFRFGLAAPS